MDRIAVRQEQSDFSGLEARTLNQPRCPVPADDLHALLIRLVDRYGTQTALAKAIKITDSRLAKVLKGESGSLSVLNCLRLAKVAKLSPSQILRAAGKSEIAALIEHMYGPTAQPPLAPDSATSTQWPERELSAKATEHLRGFLEEVARPPHKPRRRKPR